MNSSRRQFLKGLLGGVGAGVVAVLGWTRLFKESDSASALAAASSSTSLAPSAPSTSSSSAAPDPSTAADATTSVTPDGTTSSSSPPTTSVAATSTTTAPPSTSTSSTTTTTTTSAPASATTSTTVSPLSDSTSQFAAFVTVAGELPVLCKAAWGANPNLGEFTSHTIERFTVHHTAAVLSSASRAPARARQHQKFHLGKGWPDLAYHFLVDSLGNVYEGRPISAVGDTATSYDPTGHFLIAAEGNFDEQGIPVAQIAAMAELLAWAAVTYGVDPSAVRGHKDWTSGTSCPGSALYPAVSDGTLESMMRANIKRGVKSLRVICTAAADQYVKDLETSA